MSKVHDDGTCFILVIPMKTFTSYKKFKLFKLIIEHIPIRLLWLKASIVKWRSSAWTYTARLEMSLTAIDRPSIQEQIMVEIFGWC